MPTDEASAVVAADVDVPGPRSRGNNDTVSPTVMTLPSRAWRNVAGEIDWVASFDPLSVTDRAPYTVTGATITPAFSRSPALDSVTSSSNAVPVGVSPGATPTTVAVVRAPVNDTASHSRMPRAAITSGCSRTTPRRLSKAEVFSRAVSRRWDSGGSSAGESTGFSHSGSQVCAARAAPRTGVGVVPAESRGGRPGVASSVWSSHTSGCAATQRWYGW